MPIIFLLYFYYLHIWSLIIIIKCWFYFHLYKNVGETRGTIPGQVMTSSLSQPTRDGMKIVSTNERSAPETSDQSQAGNHSQCSSLWPTNTSGCTVTVRGISESCLLSDLTWSCPGSRIRRAIDLSVSRPLIGQRWQILFPQWLFVDLSAAPDIHMITARLARTKINTYMSIVH